MTLLGSNYDCDVEVLLRIEAALQSNQFVGAFLHKFENAIRDDHPLSQQIIDHIAHNKRNVPYPSLVFGGVL